MLRSSVLSSLQSFDGWILVRSLSLYFSISIGTKLMGPSFLMIGKLTVGEKNELSSFKHFMIGTVRATPIVL
jgi:hypothetical protein